MVCSLISKRKIKTAARTAQRAAISRFLQLVGVPEPPEEPPCHDPRVIHRFQRLQDLPQRSASHDLLNLSAFQRFQKDPKPRSSRHSSFSKSKIVPRGPRVTIYRACRCSRASRRASKPRSLRHSSFFESPRLSPEVRKSRLIDPVNVLELPEGRQLNFPDA